MAVTLNKANLVLKDANGNIGKIEQLSDRDLAKIKTAVSDVALVVNQSNHTPIVATTTNKGVVQLATSADVASGAIDKVVTAEQLHNATAADTATRLKGYDNGNLIYLGWDKDNLTMKVDDADYTKGVVITHLNIGSQSVNHATTADSANEATNAYNLRTTSHADHFIRSEWDGSYFWTWVRAPNGESRPVNVAHAEAASSADHATRLVGYDNPNQIFLGWNGNNLTMNVDGNDYTRGEVITHLNIGSQSVNHATTADSANEATNAYNLRTTSHADHFLQLKWNDLGQFDCYVLAPNGEYRPVRVERANSATNADSATNANHATTADNATNLGGYPASNYIRSVNGIGADVSGNVVLDQSIAISASGTNYIRFANGTQICWGYADYTNISSANVTLPVPFANLSYQVLCCDTGDGRYPLGAAPVATTYFTVYLPSTFIGFRYIAIGNWK